MVSSVQISFVVPLWYQTSYQLFERAAVKMKHKEEIIRERTGKNMPEYLHELIEFITKHVTQTILDEDLNYLLPTKDFQYIRKILKRETLMLLRGELERVKKA